MPHQTSPTLPSQPPTPVLPSSTSDATLRRKSRRATADDVARSPPRPSSLLGPSTTRRRMRIVDASRWRCEGERRQSWQARSIAGFARGSPLTYRGALIARLRLLLLLRLVLVSPSSVTFVSVIILSLSSRHACADASDDVAHDLTFPSCAVAFENNPSSLTIYSKPAHLLSPHSHRKSRYPRRRRSSLNGVRRPSAAGWKTRWARSVPRSLPSSPNTG